MSTPEKTAQDATPKHHRRRRASLGGFTHRLDAPQKKGMTMRWVNDVPGRIEQMHELGYDFAERDTRTDGEGTRIARHAGTGPNGEPIRAYLMETPDDQFAIGVKEKEENKNHIHSSI